jgi:5-hydroxyisourate hydrolase
MSAKSPITTHVLDTSLGRPAAGVPVRLERSTADGWEAIAETLTDADGRSSDLMPPGTLESGTYRLGFELDAYFAKTSRSSFYPSASIVFRVNSPGEHYHVPLLLNPFGYSTYRGS